MKTSQAQKTTLTIAVFTLLTAATMYQLNKQYAGGRFNPDSKIIDVYISKNPTSTRFKSKTVARIIDVAESHLSKGFIQELNLIASRSRPSTALGRIVIENPRFTTVFDKVATPELVQSMVEKHQALVCEYLELAIQQTLAGPVSMILDVARHLNFDKRIMGIASVKRNFQTELMSQIKNGGADCGATLSIRYGGSYSTKSASRLQIDANQSSL